MEITHSIQVMKKVGRPALPESKKRTHFVGIKLSKAELKQFEALAKKHKASLSESIRYAVAQVSA